MKKSKLILKAILFWSTILSVILLISSVDSLCDNNYFIHALIVCVTLIITTFKTISKEEFEQLSLSKWFDNLSSNE